MTTTALIIPRPVTDASTIAVTVLTEVRRAGYTTVSQITTATRIDIFRIARTLDMAVAAGIVEKEGAMYSWAEQTRGEVEDHDSAVHDHPLGTVVVLQESFGQKYVARLEEHHSNGLGSVVNRLWFPALPEERSEFFVGTLGTVVAVLHAPEEDDPRYAAEAVYARAQESRTHDASTSAPTPSHLRIAFTGKARSGKDTAAAFLIEEGFIRVAFADSLKEAALAVDPFINPGARLSEVVEDLGWERAKDAYPEVRRVLQRLGSEAGWQLHGKNLWTNLVAARLDELGDMPVVITDLRFEHEGDFLRRHGFLIVGIERGNHDGLAGAEGAHASERGDISVDVTIQNDGTLEELRAAVLALIS